MSVGTVPIQAAFCDGRELELNTIPVVEKIKEGAMWKPECLFISPSQPCLGSGVKQD